MGVFDGKISMGLCGIGTPKDRRRSGELEASQIQGALLAVMGHMTKQYWIPVISVFRGIKPIWGATSLLELLFIHREGNGRDRRAEEVSMRPSCKFLTQNPGLKVEMCAWGKSYLVPIYGIFSISTICCQIFYHCQRLPFLYPCLNALVVLPDRFPLRELWRCTAVLVCWEGRLIPHRSPQRRVVLKRRHLGRWRISKPKSFNPWKRAAAVKTANFLMCFFHCAYGFVEKRSKRVPFECL